MNRYVKLLAGFLVIAMLVLAACGDDNDKEETPTTVPGETPSTSAKPCEGGPGVLRDAGNASVTAAGFAQDAEPLRIGLLMSTTGGLAQYGPTIGNGAKLAIKCINDHGGVNGAPIEYVEADDQSLPEPAVAAATQMVEVNDVVAIIGPLGSTPVISVAESVTVPNDVILITPSGTGNAITDIEDNDLVFRTPVSDGAQGVVLANTVAEETLGLTNVCAMYVNNAYGDGLQQVFADNFDGTVTAVAHAETGVSFQSELEECTAGDPEALIAMSYTTGQADVYLREALENNIIDNFVFVDGTKDAKMFEALGWEHFDQMYGTAAGSLNTDAGAELDAMYEAEYGQPYSVPYVREAYDAVVALALAASAAGTNTDALAIRDELRNTVNAPGTQYGPGEDDLEAALTAAAAGEDIDYAGASGITEWDDNGDVSRGAIDIWQVQGEEIVVTRTVAVDLATGEITDVTDGGGGDGGGGETPEGG